MPCAKYNLQSERTFETPCKAGLQPRPQAYPTETFWAYLAHLGLNSNNKLFWLYDEFFYLTKLVR